MHGRKNIILHSSSHLVGNIWHGDIIIDFDSPFVVCKQVHDVSHSGGHPASSLVVEFVETLWAVRVGVAGS